MATLAERLANLLQAMRNCQKSANSEWLAKHRENAESLVKEHLPSGSGFDCGCNLLFEESTPECLTFRTSFHHMDEHGGYDGWTGHFIRVRASLVFGLKLTISGKNRNDIKGLIHESFESALSAELKG